MKYLSREDVLAEGARLLRASIRAQGTSNEKAAGEALAAWQERHKPSTNERRSMLRMANNVYV